MGISALVLWVFGRSRYISRSLRSLQEPQATEETQVRVREQDYSIGIRERHSTAFGPCQKSAQVFAERRGPQLQTGRPSQHERDICPVRSDAANNGFLITPNRKDNSSQDCWVRQPLAKRTRTSESHWALDGSGSRIQG